MNLLIVILIELGAVVGTGFLTYSMISKAVGQAKQALIQDVALKALESKTGINTSAVKSLVGEKPMASDPGTAIGGIANAVAGNGNFATKLAGQLMGKMPKPVKFAAGGIMTGLGATAAVGEAMGKPILRKISFGATKLANGAKLRFTNSKVGQKLINGKDKLTSGLNSVKSGITEFGDGIKKGLNSIGDGIRNSKVIKGAVGGIRHVKRIKSNVSNALADTWGYRNLMTPGEKLIADAVNHRHGGALRIVDQPARDPLLTKLNSKGENREKMHTLGELSRLKEIENTHQEKYKSESLKEFIKAKKDGNQKITGSYFAKQYAEAIDELSKQGNSSQAMLKQRMMLDLIKNSSKDMDKDTLLKATSTMYSNYIEKQNNGMEQALKAAEENYDKVALETVGDYFGKNSRNGKKNTPLGDRLDDYIKTTYNPKDSEKTQIKEETWAEIASDLDGKVAKAILTSEDREKIKKAINDKQEHYVQVEALKGVNEEVKNYREEHGVTLQKARVAVEEKNKEQNYKQALDDAIKSLDINAIANANASSTSSQSNTQNTNTNTNTATAQQIVQQTTINQQISSGEQNQPQVTAGNQVQQQGQQVSTGSQTQPQAVEQQAQQVIVESTPISRETTVQSRNVESGRVENRDTERIIERVVEKQGSNANNNTNSTNISKEQEERIAGRIAADVTADVTNHLENKITPFTNAIEKSYSWLDELGNGDVNRGIDKMTKAIDSINEGTNIKMTKTMEKMFKDMGGGDAENGAKYLRQAIENINKGTREPVADTEYDNEIVYSVAEAYIDKKTNDNPKIASFSEYKRKRKNVQSNKNAV